MIPSWLRLPSQQDSRPTEEKREKGDRGPLVAIVVAMVWIPIQITLSLIFATGGMFFLLIFGVVLGPFIGLFFLIRHLLRGDSTQAQHPPDNPETAAPGPAASDDAPLSD